MDYLFIFLVLENILEQFFPILNYFDEIITVFCFFGILIKLYHNKKIKKRFVQLILLLLFIIIVGISSNVIYGIQTSNIAVIKDVLAFTKFFIVYLYAIYVRSNGITDRKFKKICKFSRFFSIILVIFAFINLFIDIGMDSGYRNGIKTFRFLYSHTTFMVSSLIAMSTVLIVDGIKKNRIYLFFFYLTMFFSMRDKAFIYITVSLFLMIVINRISHKKERKLKLNFKKNFIITCVILLSIFICANLFKSKIIEYFNWGLSAARPALYIVGIRLMIDFFPIGTGFGTFASSISGDYYSPIYRLYGISSTSGLGKAEGYPYMADTFWPYIMGQFGVIGTVLYLLSLVVIFKTITKMYKNDKDKFVAALSLFFYLITGCFVESMMTNSFIVLFAFSIGYYINEQDT